MVVIGAAATANASPADSLAAGAYLLPNGIEYWSNGQGHTCSFSSPVDGQQLAAASIIPYFPPGIVYDGLCGGGGISPPGIYMLPDKEYFFSNGTGQTCLYGDGTLSPQQLASAFLGDHLKTGHS